MNARFAILSLVLVLSGTFALAQENDLDSPEIPTLTENFLDSPAAAESFDPQTYSFYPGWFVGVGGSYNSVKVESVFSGIGRTEVYSGGVLVAVGTAGGPAPPFRETQSTLAPAVQLGFFQNFDNSSLLWGAKFSYKYLGLTFSDDGFDAPQVGVYEILNPPSTTTFTGNAVTESAQTIVNHELALMPFIGTTLPNGRFYAGGGPVVFDTQTRMYGLMSFADINGTHTNIGGAPLNLASSQMIWGGAAQMGMTYYISQTAFFDISYDFMVTRQNAQYYPVDVTSSSGGLDFDTAITYKEELRIWAQSLTVTLNVMF